jgi:hypothetical protein
MAPTPSFADLEQAALHVIRLIRDIPSLENTKLAVIGDLAVCRYLPRHACPAVRLARTLFSNPCIY